jgi:short-subunit dehydrogenase
MKKLTKEQFGEWAVITGASSGIGREMAQIIAQKGINTILIARDKSALITLSLELEKNTNVKTEVIVADLSKNEEIDKVISQCSHLEVGLLINSAGYALSGEFTENSLTDELDMLNVNVKAPLQLTHYFAKKMKEKKRGGIIFLSSIMALVGTSKWANYNATKAHNLLLAEGLTRELKKDNINVLAMIVGPVKSGFQERSNSKTIFWSMSPQRVAKYGLWMLGCRSTYIPGLINKFIVLSTRLNPRIINSYIFSSVLKQLIIKVGR